MPSVLSVLLTAALDANTTASSAEVGPTDQTAADAKKAAASQYELRAHAGSLLAYMVDAHASSYPALRTRVVATLLRALLAGTRRFVDDDAEAANGHHDPASDDTERPRTGVEALAQAEARKTMPVAESAGTKLGAVIGLRRLGSVPLRAFLFGSKGVEEPSKARNATYLLGRWLGLQQKQRRTQGVSPDADPAAEWIVAEIVAAAHGLTAPVLAPTESAQDEKTTLEKRFGTFWVQALGTDTRARKGLLSVVQDEALEQNAGETTAAGTAASHPQPEAEEAL